MSPHLFKLRARRFWRRQAAQTLAVAHTSSEAVEKFGLARLGRLRQVWRFVLAWVGLCVVLAGILLAQINALRPYYQTFQPIPGGRYTEGIAGSFTTANPLYALSDVDTSVARLLFSGLLRYDNHNRLIGDLARSWSVDATGKIYRVSLRPSITWNDGAPITAADVAYTYHVIQNPDAQSPLYASWHGVDVRALDKQTVQFTLPNPLSSFPSSLTNGIVPQHILRRVDPVDLRSASFNTAHPVGSGPFQWSSIGVNGIGDSLLSQISLVPFQHYWAGVPKLTSFNIYAYADEKAMVRAYQNQEITAMTGLSSVPASLAHDQGSHMYNLPLLAGVYVFFRASTPLLHDAAVRQALVLAADRTAVLGTLGYPAVIVDEPLLKRQFAYDTRFEQHTNNLAAAQALLDKAGWKIGSDGLRHHKGQVLRFALSLTDAPEYHRVSLVLKDSWSRLGVDVQLAPQPAADFQYTLSSHGYDAALYGVTIGVDPDVFVYWDSSQADPRSASRLNFSEYHSGTADIALEAGRTRANQRLRVLKYQGFLKAWRSDAPALGLYQPRLLYISHEHVFGLDLVGLSSDADRYRNVQNWMIHQGWVTNP